MSAVILPRGGPVQTAVENGGMTYVQSICSEYACSPTGLELQCVDDLHEGYDMQNATVYMQCGAISDQPWPYYDCTGTVDYGCPSNNPQPTPKPTSSAVSDRLFGGNTMGLLLVWVVLLSFIRRYT
ncbi:hypothetical protein C8R45DRAFT_938868 [Mycena sanguinolenta]|nr:hypothetical protein C8R45DRAFT_938868 [Mycena sanguinolenta]